MSESLQSKSAPVLRLDQVCKAFGGVKAADNISLEVFKGELVGLIGPNGSGKTTLLNVISGIYAADSGHIYLEGREITHMATHKRSVLGIARTFQHPRLLTRCDIMTNVEVGIDLAVRKKQMDRAACMQRLQLLLKEGHLDGINLSDSTEKLSYGQQKILEIVRAILTQPKLLLIDEPAAGLNANEMQYIVDLFKFATGEGMGLLLIEHSMDLIMSICDKITVLNFGRQIATGLPAEIQSNQEVIKAYLGGESKC